MNRPRLAFCEPVTATTRSLEHIRAVDGPLMLGGGIVGPALCGYDMTRGWDLSTEVTAERIRARVGAEVNPTCVRCGQIALVIVA